MERKPIRLQIRSALRWTAWVLLAQLVLINLSSAFYADKLTRFYGNLPEDYSNSSGNIFTKSWKLFTGPKYPRAAILERPVYALDTVSLVTGNGLRIDAWMIRTDSLARGTVILFHGVGGTRMNNLDEANEFRYRGYQVMMLDFRGHGNSGGNTTTIGMREAEEVKLAYDYVQRNGEKNIFLFGSSMGAVAVARAVSKYNLQPSGLMLEMPFYSLQTYLKARAGQIGFPTQPFAFFTTFWIGIEKGFNGFSHRTTRYMKGVHCPVLLQWGTQDAFVNGEETEKIYEAIATDRKKLIVYSGAQHESLLRKDPVQWRMETEEFLKTYTR